MLRVALADRNFEINLPLAGGFQASNALVAAALAIGLGDTAEKVFAALEKIKGAPGRLEKVAFSASRCSHLRRLCAHARCAGVGVESASSACCRKTSRRVRLRRGSRQGQASPDGRNRRASRRYGNRHRRQPAQRGCDTNPSRDFGCVSGSAGNRRPRAGHSRRYRSTRQPGDALVIAGKGHETGQIVASETRPFSDSEEAVKSAVAFGGRARERVHERLVDIGGSPVRHTRRRDARVRGERGFPSTRALSSRAIFSWRSKAMRATVTTSCVRHSMRKRVRRS
jgi:UDP-N-acetylmuramoyl-L-alanyl-D-glutamate--2,6-diaminopimelate ligase